MMCVEDYLDTLAWGRSIGGLPALIARADANAKAVADWVAKTPWIDFLATDPATRSTTSICLKVVDPWFAGQSDENQENIIGAMTKILDKEQVAYDIKGYRDAPAGLRIWGGATVELSDVKALLNWLEWAYEAVKSEANKQAA
jgi:phosphoserine aminotransferase